MVDWYSALWLAAESHLAVVLLTLTVLVLWLEFENQPSLRLAAESLLAVVLVTVLVFWLELDDHPALRLVAECHLAVVLLTVLLSWLQIEDLPALCLAAESLHPVVLAVHSLRLGLEEVPALRLAVVDQLLGMGFLHG